MNHLRRDWRCTIFSDTSLNEAPHGSDVKLDVLQLFAASYNVRMDLRQSGGAMDPEIVTVVAEDIVDRHISKKQANYTMASEDLCRMTKPFAVCTEKRTPNQDAEEKVSDPVGIEAGLARYRTVGPIHTSLDHILTSDNSSVPARIQQIERPTEGDYAEWQFVALDRAKKEYRRLPGCPTVLREHFIVLTLKLIKLHVDISGMIGKTQEVQEKLDDWWAAPEPEIDSASAQATFWRAHWAAIDQHVDPFAMHKFDDVEEMWEDCPRVVRAENGSPDERVVVRRIDDPPNAGFDVVLEDLNSFVVCVS